MFSVFTLRISYLFREGAKLVPTCVQRFGIVQRLC